MQNIMLLALLLCCCTLIVQQASANVMGIDFASDAMKVALVQAGTPMEIVTNFQSKRKTPTCLTFYRGERLFGSDAFALMPRKPELTFCKAYRMLGRGVEHPAVQDVLHEQYFPYEVYANETYGSTGVLQFKQEETHYTAEEIIAMLMQHAKEISASFGEGKKVRDCVITVPSYFTQHERSAVYTAAEIADLKVLSLVEENTAAALHYGIDRTPEGNQTNTVLFYNMGAGSTQVSIVTYSNYVTKDGFSSKNKTVGQFEVVGKAWDTKLGGFNFDVALANLFADRFNEGWSKKKSYPAEGGDVRHYVRPMTRLRVLANNVKEVLSANPEFPVKADQLHADVDLNTKVTRAEFESAAADLLSRVTEPIERALRNAGLKLSDVDSVELLGGGVRVPSVKKALEEYFKTSDKDHALELGQHLNGDEAMAMGAAFRAANLSTSFKVRKVGAVEASSFPVSVRLETLPVEDEEAASSTGGWLGGLFGSSKKVENKKTATASEEAAAEATAALAEGVVDAEGSTTSSSSSVWSKFTSLYPVNSRIPSKIKTVAFQYDKDLLCHIEYDQIAEEDSTATAPVVDVALDGGKKRVARPNMLPVGTHPLVASFNVTGVAAFAKETAGRAGVGADGKEILPKVHLSFSIDGSGIVQLVKAEATFELPPVEEKEEEKEEVEKASASPSDVGNDDEKKEEEDGDKEEDEKKNEEGSEEEKDDSSNSNSNSNKDDDDSNSGVEDKDEEKASEKASNKKAEKKVSEKSMKKKPSVNILRRTLSVVSNGHLLLQPPAWTEEAKAEARARLQELTAIDAARKAKEAALNELEAYVYRVKNRLSDDDEELDKVSTREEREAVNEAATSAEDWLYDEGREADLAGYKQKQAELTKMANAIFHKYDEIQARGTAVESAHKKMSDMKSVSMKWPEKKPYINETEREEFAALLAEHEAWLEEKLTAQLALSLRDTPAFESTEIGIHMKPLVGAFNTLNKRKPPPPPPEEKKKEKKEKKSENATSPDTEAPDTADSSDTNNTIKVELETDDDATAAGDINAETETTESTNEEEESSSEQGASSSSSSSE